MELSALVMDEYVYEIDYCGKFNQSLRRVLQKGGYETAIPIDCRELEGATVDRLAVIHRHLETVHKKNAFDKEQIENELVETIVSELDPYSAYISETAVKRMTWSRGAVGVAIGSSGRHEIEAVIDGSPAMNAGILRGDRIVSIDARSTSGMTAGDVLGLLQGELGSVVEVEVERNGERKSFSMLRKKVEARGFKAKWLADSLLYLDIERFSLRSNEWIQRALAKLLREKVGDRYTVIIDLRGNTGGVLSAAIKLADHMLGNQELIVSTNGRTTNSKLRFKARAGDAINGNKVYVLVDKGSAGAAEILAAALRDNGRATVLGQTSFGMHLIQTIHPLKQGGAIKLSTAEYFSPKGKSFRGGIKPDYCIDMKDNKITLSRGDDRCGNKSLIALDTDQLGELVTQLEAGR